jgi:hypothetical protein
VVHEQPPRLDPRIEGRTRAGVVGGWRRLKVVNRNQWVGDRLKRLEITLQAGHLAA